MVILCPRRQAVNSTADTTNTEPMKVMLCPELRRYPGNQMNNDKGMLAAALPKASRMASNLS